jgi:hypothetical protein
VQWSVKLRSSFQSTLKQRKKTLCTATTSVSTVVHDELKMLFNRIFHMCQNKWLNVGRKGKYFLYMYFLANSDTKMTLVHLHEILSI